MTNNPREFPPFVKTWRQLYFLVIGALLIEIILFYVLMRWFS